MSRAAELRWQALFITAVSLSLIAGPFRVEGWLPRDPMEPHKVSIGAAALMGMTMVAGFMFSATAVITGFIAARRREWLGLALSIPAPLVTLSFLIFFWVIDGM